MRVLPVLTVVLSACATGSDGGAPDASQAADIDADIKIDAPRIDAMTIDAIPIDAMAIDAMPSGAVDTCAQAANLTTGAMGASGVIVAGDTTGYANDVEPASSCTGFGPDGPDAIYYVDATVGQVLTATVTGAWDSSIYIGRVCATHPMCVIGADTGLSGDPETVTHTVATAGTYYVVVDGWSTTAYGAYSLTVRLQ